MTKYRHAWAAAVVYTLSMLWPGISWSTTNACWFDPKVVKLTYELTVAAARREEFIRYVQTEVANERLSYSAVESDSALTMILQNVDSGILAIEIENVKRTNAFRIEVKACDFTKDWRPYWNYVKEHVERFDEGRRR